jgi:hypothetical protein
MGTLLVAAMAMSTTTCTLLLDHNAVQCKTSDDCAHLATNHPLCQNGLCVPSRLQPNQCFLVDPPTVPTMEKDFLNSCSTNAMQAGLNDPVGSCLTFTTKFDPGAMISPPPTTMPNAAKPATPPTALCTSLVPAGKQILYITGSSNFAPLLQELSQVIVNSISIVPVFRTTLSCVGVKSMNMMSPTYADDHTIKDPTGTTADKYPTYAQIYLGDGHPPVPCLLGKDGAPVDIGESEIAQDTCGPPVNPPEVGESLGPILPIIFVVPKLSNQKVISSAAAYQVFGGGGGVPPWEDPHFLFIRAGGTATLRLVAKQIGLPLTQFWGTDQGSAAAMAANLGGLTTVSDANSALGMIGSDYYDQPANRNLLKALGFQANDQSCAYLPDSTLNTFDKINVRDGHYPLWGRIHFFATRSGGGFTSPAAASFLGLFANPVLDSDIFDALIKAGFVPPCAMKVTRSEELGDFTYADPPAVNCTCAFEAQVSAPLDAYCKACTTPSDCTSDRPLCRYGYCERESS